MTLNLLKEESSKLHSQLEQITKDIREAETLALKTAKYTDVQNWQKLKEWRGILQGKLITNQNKLYRLRETKL